MLAQNDNVDAVSFAEEILTNVCSDLSSEEVETEAVDTKPETHGEASEETKEPSEEALVIEHEKMEVAEESTEINEESLEQETGEFY